MRRYVGISGVTGEDDAMAVCRLLDELDPAGVFYGKRSVAVGVLASEKTLRGETNRYPLRYPHRAEIAECFGDDPRILNVLHVSVDDPNRCADVLCSAIGFAGPNCHAMQINVAWPAYCELARVNEYARRERAPGFALILQVGPRALAPYLPADPLGAREALTELTNALAPYLNGFAGRPPEAVLFDVSGGTGGAIRPAFAERLIEHLSEVFNGGMALFGVAGGLDGASVPGLASLLRSHGRTCIDAEGRLRTTEDGGGRLDLGKAAAYLAAARDAYLGGPPGSVFRVRGGGRGHAR